MVDWEEIQMGRGAGMRFALVAAPLALGLAFCAPAASARTEDIIAPSDPDHPAVDSGWQAGTCTEEPPESAEFCSVATKGQYFEAAAGHPQHGFTQFIVKYDEPVAGLKDPVGELKTVRVDLPPGLTVNPQATPQCPQATFEANPEGCPAGSAVGESLVTASVAGAPTPLPTPPLVYNIEPPEGQPARFGFNLLGNDVYLEADVAWQSDYHEGFTIHVPETPFAKALELGLPLLQGGVVLQNRLVFDGRSGDGTFITTPTTCLGEATSNSPFRDIYSTWLLASSIGEETQPGYAFPDGAGPPFDSRIPPGTSPKDCAAVPFDPSLSVDPNTSDTDSPSGAAVAVELPEIEGGESQAGSQVRSARATLPAGMGLNPSAATGLEACTDAQFGKGTRDPVACPPASRIGTVEVDTPPLPDGSLSGPVYVGRQLSRDPASGGEYRIFVDAESSRYGISARLLGRIVADPQTGRLTTVFDDGALGSVSLPGLPQVPFKSFRIKLDGGARAALTSPSSCGPSTTAAQLTPWTSAVGIVPPGGEEGPSTAPPAIPSSDFSLSGFPGGGACPPTLAARPFAPGFSAGTADNQAGAYSPLHMDIARADGNQELKGVDVTLPPGLTAKLAGVSYCPESALAAAAARSGGEEAARSSCPGSSLIGQADVAAGSGPAPIHIQGKVFLAGPYKGAPLSLAVVTPATAGPFDLGTVVVRVALFIDRRTAQARAQSDPIPHVYGGATLDVRKVAVQLDRHEFSLNPTSCSPGGFGGSLLGGGADPTDPRAFSSAPASAAFATGGCEKLGFRPKVFLRLFGATRRAKNPKLRAVVLPRAGDADFARVATILPRALILDQGNLAKVCTRVQFAAGECPRNSIYGYARAFSPLLDKPLQGPVYLRSSDNALPDLVADLRGQVEIELDSRTDSVHGHIRNTFDVVPDVPVSKFVLTMRGGSRGLLVNSRNQCPRRRAHRGRRGGGHAHRRPARTPARKHTGGRRRGGPRAIVHLKAQNGKKLDLRPRLRAPCGKHRRHRHHRRK
jgi:hypothetical protein